MVTNQSPVHGLGNTDMKTYRNRHRRGWADHGPTALIFAGALAAIFSTPANAQDFDKGLRAYSQKQFVAARAEFQPLAEAGQANAQYYMGAIFGLGRGVDRDLDRAETWFGKAAQQGHARALFSLGNIHRMRSDTDGAIRYFKMAADKGVRSAQYNLGVLYATGDGVGKDVEEAFKWYARAAENGHATAQYNLGIFYRDGLGTAADARKAIEWLARAAENGNVFAQINLARMFTLGNGVPRNLGRAYTWLEVTQHPFGGTQNGAARDRIANVRNSAVAARKLLEEQMSPANIARSKARARDWLSEFGNAGK